MAAVFVAMSAAWVPSYADSVDPLNPDSTPSQSESTADPLDRLPTSTGQPKSDTYDKGEIRDYMKTYDPMNDEITDNKIANKLLGAVGKLTSFLAVLAFSLFFFVTILDLLYITVPFLRPLLADANEDGQGNSLPGMGRPGMGGGAGAVAPKKAFMNRQWVSDEAVDTVKRFGGSSQAQVSGMAGSGVGPMGGMGGMGGIGGMSTGAIQNQDDNSVQNPLSFYFRARLTTMIFLGICLVVLLSSIVMGFGMDVGTFILKVIASLGEWISGQDVSDIF